MGSNLGSQSEEEEEGGGSYDNTLFLDHLTAYVDSEGSNSTLDFTKPHLKPSLRYVYPLFVLLHAFVFIAGTVGNTAMLVVIMRRRLYRNPMFFFLGNMALSDVIKCTIVMPLTLTNLLLQNFIFGSFLCFFLPMLHSFPNHATMLTYLSIAIDRYRFIVHPMKSRVPAGLCTIAVWVIAVCVVLPYAVYIKYVDMGVILPHLFDDGVGVCLIDQERHIEEYIRAMFVILFCLPLAIIAFLYVRVSAELQTGESPAVSIHIEENMQSLSETSYHSRTTFASGLGLAEPEVHMEPERVSTDSGHLRVYPSNSQQDCHHEEDDIDMRKEKRTQKYMIAMVTLFAICWCPVKILILVTHFVYDENHNTDRYDITYLTFTFFAFLSSCINPVLFASWRMSNRTKDRLRGYFRFSNRRRSSAQTTQTVSHSRNRSIATEEAAGHCLSNGKDASADPNVYS